MEIPPWHGFSPGNSKKIGKTLSKERASSLTGTNNNNPQGRTYPALAGGQIQAVLRREGYHKSRKPGGQQKLFTRCFF